MKCVLFALTFLVVLCSGCRQCWTPDVCPPDTFVEGGYMEDLPDKEIPIVDWWNHFNDPILVQMVERALSCNLTLRAARQRVIEFKGLYGVAFSPLFPSAEYFTSLRRSKESGTFVENGNPFFINSYDSGVTSFWNLDLFGRNLDAARAAWLDVCATTEELRDVHVNIAAETAIAYLNMRANQQRIKFTKESIEREEELLELTRLRLEAGLITQLDYAEAQLLVRQRQNNLIDFQIALKRNIYSLAVFLGENPEELSYLYDETKDLPFVMGKVPLGIPGELLCRRGDIRQAEMLMRAAGARVMVARKELLPVISISGLFHYITGFYRKWFDGNSQGWSLSPLLTFPLFQGGRIFSNIDAVTAFQRQRVLAYQQTVLVALQELETALAIHFLDIQLREIKIKRLESALESFDLALKRYQAGRLTFLNVSINARELFTSEILLIDVEEAIMTTLVAIYRALGGGWEPPPNPCP